MQKVRKDGKKFAKNKKTKQNRSKYTFTSCNLLFCRQLLGCVFIRFLIPNNRWIRSILNGKSCTIELRAEAALTDTAYRPEKKGQRCVRSGL